MKFQGRLKKEFVRLKTTGISWGNQEKNHVDFPSAKILNFWAVLDVISTGKGVCNTHKTSPKFQGVKVYLCPEFTRIMYSQE